MNTSFAEKNEGDNGINAAVLAGQLLEQSESAAGTTPRREGTGPSFRYDNGYAKPESLEWLAERPAQIRQDVTLLTDKGFTNYVNKFALPGTAVFFNRDDTFVAVIDYHVAEAGIVSPEWGRHRARYTVKRTPEWLRWTSKDNVGMTQEAFAQWLEDWYLDIAEPDAAKIIEQARHMEATVNVTFESQVNADNGSRRFTYNEFVNNGARKDEIDFLNGFTLAIPIFEGLDSHHIKARVRYTIGQNGKLLIRYMLIGAFEAEREAVDEIAGKVSADTPTVTHYDGLEPPKQVPLAAPAAR